MQIQLSWFLGYGEQLEGLPPEIGDDLYDTYIGGITQCFIQKSPENSKVYYLDLNSSYPSVFIKNDGPMNYLGLYDWEPHMNI